MHSLRWALPLSSFVVIATGAGLAIAGNTTVGLIVAAVGVVDLAMVPFVLRRVGYTEAPDRGPLSTPDAPAGEATADPSHNPYARED